MLTSNITDIDVFWGFVHSGPSFAYRRMLTHSVVGLLILSVICALIFSRLYKNQNWKTWFGVSLIGTSVHVFFDLLNSYGVVFLYPFSRHRFEWAWVFIIDLAIWSMLLIPLLMAIPPTYRSHLERMSKWAVVTLTIYVSICGLLRWRAGELLENWTNAQNNPPSFAYVFPEALGPHRFRGVTRTGDTYSVHLIHALTGTMDPPTYISTEENSVEVQKILEQPAAKNLMWFFKAPVWTKGEKTGVWDVSDLRFQSLVIFRDVPFRYTFRLKD